MVMKMFKLSQKYIDFCKDLNTKADFLEGTTASGKTTIGAGVKFMLKVSMSPKKLHIISAKTTGVAEKNILQQDNGILDIHHNARYFGNGDKSYKIPHIKFEDKIILILGYDNKDKWKSVLGGQYGCVFIDECNTADIEFIREISTRNDYMMCTLNPDNPDLPVYKEFVNRSRPYKRYAKDVPHEVISELIQPERENWRYWFFTFYDNAGLTEEQIQNKINNAPVGTKLYKNKILGLRGKATGLVFSNFDRKRHVISDVSGFNFVQFSAGLDTAYSTSSPDTIAMSYIGITDNGICVLLDEKVYNNADIEKPLAPSDTAVNFIEFLNRNGEKYGYLRHTFIDSADQATITELNKYKRQNGCIYTFNGAWKKTKIIDRINLQLGWFAEGTFLINANCKAYQSELEIYSWREDKDAEPEDGNDHLINSVQYAWLPYKKQIGGVKIV